MKNKSKIVALLGASGSGKTFLVNQVISKYSKVGIVRKISTRPARPGEENSIEIRPGCDKQTVLATDYISCINAILNDPTVPITYTGYSRQDIDGILGLGKIAVVITNTENYQKLKVDYSTCDVIPIYIERLYPSKEAYYAAMRAGGRKDDEIEARYRVAQTARHELLEKNINDIGENIIQNNVGNTREQLRKQFESIAERNGIDLGEYIPKIILAVDSYKDCMSSACVEDYIDKGLKSKNNKAQIIKIPIADGGEGTVDVLTTATGGHIEYCIAEGPYMELIEAKYGVLGDDKTVVIELASTCALHMVTGDKRNPMNTTTYGIGTVIKDAISKGYRRFILGLGGLCVCEGGVGALQSLGFKFKDDVGNVLEIGQGGKQLKQIKDIDISSVENTLRECQFIIASDVKNPLCGYEGASYTYGPQKGATQQMVEELDDGLTNYANVINKITQIDIINMEGAGAAGGFGAAFVALLGAKMQGGAKICLDAYKFGKQIMNADYVITGEGTMDKQTPYGKVPYSVAVEANKVGVPVIAICGKVELDEKEIQNMGISKTYEISCRNLTLDENIANCSHNLIKNAKIVANDIFQINSKSKDLYEEERK